MDRKLGAAPLLGRGAGIPSNAMWPGPRPTFTPSFVLIHETVWSQYINVTDRQTTVRQHIGRTVLQTVAQKPFGTRMWANAQPDGRPAEYKWHPLFNAAKFG